MEEYYNHPIVKIDQINLNTPKTKEYNFKNYGYYQ